MRIDLESGEQHVLRSSSSAAVEPGYLSIAEAITFPTGGGRSAHAFFYAPRNRDFRGADGERPPLIVMTHGGPTGAASAALKWGVQYWTSRGFAVVDVNYGGSSGYGRAYRERLNGQWGVVDVDDAVNAARCLAERGAVDADADRDPRRQRRRLHHAWRADLPRFLQGRRQPLRHQRPRGAGARHPQVRVALPRPADRPLPGRASAVPRALADPLDRRASAAR